MGFEPTTSRLTVEVRHPDSRKSVIALSPLSYTPEEAQPHDPKEDPARRIHRGGRIRTCDLSHPKRSKTSRQSDIIIKRSTRLSYTSMHGPNSNFFRFLQWPTERHLLSAHCETAGFEPATSRPQSEVRRRDSRTPFFNSGRSPWLSYASLSALSRCLSVGALRLEQGACQFFRGMRLF